MDQELVDAAADAPGRRCMCTHQVAALFCMKWPLSSTYLCCYIKNPTTLIELYLLKNNPTKFHPDLIWNDGA